MERSLENSGKVPRIVQVMCFKDFSRPSAYQPAEQNMPQVWEAQWQQVLKMLQQSHVGWGNPQLTEAVPWDDTKSFLSAFEQVAEACRWPRDEWVSRLLPALRGGMEQIYCRLDARDRGDYAKVKAALLRGDVMRAESKRQHFRQCCSQELGGPRRIYSQLQELCRQWLKPDHHTKEQILELIIQEQLLAMLPPDVRTWVWERGPEDCIEAVALAEDFLVGRQAGRMWKWPDRTVNSSEAEGPLTDTMARQRYTGLRQKHEGEHCLTSERMSARNSGFMVPPERQEMAGASLAEGFVNLERAGWTTVDLDQKPLPWEITQENRGNISSLEGHVAPAPYIISQPAQGGFFSHITETGETIPGVIPNGRILRDIKVENYEERDSEAGDPFEAPAEDAVPTSSQSCKDSFRRKLRPRGPQGAKRGRPKKRGTHMKLRKKSAPEAPKKSKERRHRCSQCGHWTCYWSDMLRHMGTHTGKRPYRCAECGRTFTHLSSFQTHQQLHEPATRLKSVKTKPGKKGMRRSRLGKYTCSKCGKRVTSLSAFAEHIRSHSRGGTYQCQECGKSFKWMTSLYRHWTVYGCRGCPNSSKDKKPVKAVGGASAHVEKIDSKDGLATLVRKTQSTLSQAPGACEASPISRLRPRKPQGVTPETSMARTRMKSSGEKPYKCLNCGRTFGWSSNFYKHCRTGCKQTFPTEDTPVEHQAADTGDEGLCKVKQEEIKTEDEFGVWPGEAPALAECVVILEDEEELIHILERNAQNGGTKLGGLLGTLREGSPDATSESTEESEIGAVPKRNPTVLRLRRRRGKSTQKKVVVAKKSKYSQKERKHTCSVCGHRTYYLSDLLRHMRVHTGERPFKCLDCGKTFTQSSALHFHQKIHSAGCGPNARKGLVKHGTGRKGKKSPAGRKITGKLAGIVKRAQNCFVEGPYKCTDCGRGFTWPSNLSRHQKLHKASGKTLLVGRRKMRAGRTKSSEMMVENPPQGRAILKRMGSTSAEITRGVASVTVVINDGGSRTSKKLAEGNLAQVGRPVCPKRGAPYHYKSGLATSQKTFAKKRPYQCRVCGKSFMFRCYLADHENIHTGAKPYECYECGQKFRWKSKMQRHLKMHTGEKSYQCPECDKSFFQKDGLMIHLKSHGSSCMYACSDCGRRFMEREQLFIHQKSHVGQ